MTGFLPPPPPRSLPAPTLPAPTPAPAPTPPAQPTGRSRRWLAVLAIAILGGGFAVTHPWASTGGDGGTVLSAPTSSVGHADATDNGASRSTDNTGNGGGGGDTTFTEVNDDGDHLKMQVPSTWNVVGRAPASAGTGEYSVEAAPDLDAFSNTPGVTGAALFMAAVDSVTAQPVDFSNHCGRRSETSFGDHGFSGPLITWSHCDSGGQISQLIARSSDSDFALVVFVGSATSADRQAANHVLATFGYTR